MSTNAPAKIAIVGLGWQGKGIAGLLMEHGYEVTGAVDVGDMVGKPFSEFVPHAKSPKHPVFGSIKEMLDTTGIPDAAILSASVHSHLAAELATELLEKGIDVLTLTEDFFEGQGPLVEKLDAVAKAHGATILSGGLQDNMWVHLPASAAASVTHIHRVVLDDFGETSFFSKKTGELDAGMGMNDAEFAEWKKERLVEPPMQGAPLRETARVLGFTPTDTVYEIEPIKATAPAYWSGADMTIPVGNMLGSRLHVVINTKEGPVFEGILVFKLGTEPGEENRNSITIHGRETLSLHMPKPDHLTLTWLGLVRRVPEVLKAKPGFLRVSELPAPKYTHPIG